VLNKTIFVIFCNQSRSDHLKLLQMETKSDNLAVDELGKIVLIRLKLKQSFDRRPCELIF